MRYTPETIANLLNSDDQMDKILAALLVTRYGHKTLKNLDYSNMTAEQEDKTTKGVIIGTVDMYKVASTLEYILDAMNISHDMELEIPEENFFWGNVIVEINSEFIAMNTPYIHTVFINKDTKAAAIDKIKQTLLDVPHVFNSSIDETQIRAWLENTSVAAVERALEYMETDNPSPNIEFKFKANFGNMAAVQINLVVHSPISANVLLNALSKPMLKHNN